MKLKNCFLIIFFTVFILSIFLNTSFSYATDVKATSPSCIMIDSKSGKIIYEKNGYKKMYPASTTKMLTAILVIEKCNLSDIATVSANSVSLKEVPESYTRADLVAGEKLTIEALLNVLLIPSANDAAVVLAEHVSGSVANFSKEMNKKAKELGCTNTNFVNPNGVHNDNQYTTAYDLSLIAKYCMQNETFRSIVCKTTYTLPATNIYKKADRTFKNTNELLNSKEYKYEYTTGIKTGYTEHANYCLAASAKKDDYEFIIVVLGSEMTDDKSERAVDCINLFNYAFDNYYEKKIIDSTQIIKEIPIKLSNNTEQILTILPENDITVTTATNIDNIQPEITINEDLGTPTLKGFIVGKITYTIDGTQYSSNLIAGNNIIDSDILPTIFLALLGILAFFILLSVFQVRNSKKKKKSNNSVFMKFYR